MLGVAFGPFSVGLCKGYTSPALASLQQTTTTSDQLMMITNITTNSSSPTTLLDGSVLHISDQEGSWVASLSLVGALVGGLLASQLLNLGRKACLTGLALPFTAAWCLTVFATCVEMVYATAFLAGVCSAVVNIISQVEIDRHTDK